MAIQRIKSPYYITPPATFTGARLSSTSYSFFSNYSFISTGQIGTTIGTKYQVHRINGSTVTISGNLTFSQSGYIDILLVGAGGSGGRGYFSQNTNLDQWLGAGGGGAGGVLIYYNQEVTAGVSYAYTVGTSTAPGIYAPGGNTSFLGYTAFGGGTGGGNSGTSRDGASGGGGSYNAGAGTQAAGTAVSGQGFVGGSGDSSARGGGGGGYTTVGAAGNAGGNGGNGIAIDFDGTYRALSAGGGGGAFGGNNFGLGGLVDGRMEGGAGSWNGNAAAYQNPTSGFPISFGCGGGGGSSSNTYTSGGHGTTGVPGLLIIRYII